MRVSSELGCLCQGREQLVMEVWLGILAKVRDPS